MTPLSRGWRRLNRCALLFGFTTILLTGCGLQPTSNAPSDTLRPVQVTGNHRALPDDIAHWVNRPDTLWARIGHGLTWASDRPEVTIERDHFLAQSRLFEVLSARANPGLAWIVQEVELRGLPMELAMVPIIESMLDPWAYSSQRAAGLWQISPSTAAHYGLEKNWWYDARLDIPIATEFGLDYLTELYAEFDDDWALALAAYNGGRGRVSRAIKAAKSRGQPTDYWSLNLPRETRRYLPRVLAMASLIKAPEDYGLTLPELSINHNMVAINTGGQIELARVAAMAELETGVVRKLNPAQLRWATAPDGPGTLWLPQVNANRFHRELAALPQEERVSWAHYRVAPGDSLSAIASRFDTQVRMLQAINGIDGSFIRAGDELMIPKGARGIGLPSLAMRTWPPSNTTRHTVKSGDSLWLIARRYQVSVDDLVQWNRLSSNAYLQPGQVLRIPR